jgi:hypothetical protein
MCVELKVFHMVCRRGWQYRVLVARTLQDSFNDRGKFLSGIIMESAGASES